MDTTTDPRHYVDDPDPIRRDLARRALAAEPGSRPDRSHWRWLVEAGLVGLFLGVIVVQSWVLLFALLIGAEAYVRYFGSPMSGLRSTLPRRTIFFILLALLGGSVLFGLVTGVLRLG